MSTWEVTHLITGGGAGTSGPFNNVMHVHSPNDTTATANSVTGAFNTFWSAIKAAFPTSSNVQVASKIVRVDVGPPVFVPNTPTNVAGTATNTYAPGMVCCCVSWRSAVATRGGRGRTFLGPLAATMLPGDGGLNATTCNTIQVAANALLTNLAAIDPVIALVVWHRPLRGPGGAIITAGRETPITSATVSTIPKTQRRRM